MATDRLAATGWTAFIGCSAIRTATATWIRWTAISFGPRSRRSPPTPATFGTSTSTGTATWTAATTASSTAGSAGLKSRPKKSGGACRGIHPRDLPTHTVADTRFHGVHTYRGDCHVV